MNHQLLLSLICVSVAPTLVTCFGALPVLIQQRQQQDVTVLFSEPPQRRQQAVYLDTKLTTERVKSLFAWVSRAFDGDPRYNNLMIGMAAIFGTNLPPDSEI